MKNGYRVIDIHSHIYPEKIALKAAGATDSFYGTKAACGGTAEEYLRRTEGVIELSIVHSVATTPRQVRSINAYIASVCEANAGRLVGYGTMHLESDDFSGDMEHLLAHGLRGIKLHPDIQHFRLDDPRAMEIYRLCGEAGIPVLLHTGDTRYDYSNPNRLRPVVEALPNVTFIGAHFGGWSLWREAPKLLCGLKNLYYDCSSSLMYLTPEEAADCIRILGADRMFFGVDYPMWEPLRELDRFFALPLTAEERKMILYENARRVLLTGE